MYVRFTIPSDSRRPEPHVATGIFCASGRLQDASRFETWQDDLLQEAYEWFNANVPHPKKVAARAIFWFRPEAREAIARVWRMTKLVESIGIPVQVYRQRDPGLIVYRDDVQVAAIPRRRPLGRTR